VAIIVATDGDGGRHVGVRGGRACANPGEHAMAAPGGAAARRLPVAARIRAPDGRRRERGRPRRATPRRRHAGRRRRRRIRPGAARLYRIRFQHDPAGGALQALYIPQFTGRLQVSLNGVPVIDSTRGQTSLRLGQGAPQLVPLPEQMLRPGGNTLELALGGRMGAGAVGPVYFGPDAELRDHHEAAHFLVVALPRLMAGALFAIGAIMLMIWLTRRHDQLYLLCATIS